MRGSCAQTGSCIGAARPALCFNSCMSGFLVLPAGKEWYDGLEKAALAAQRLNRDIPVGGWFLHRSGGASRPDHSSR